MLLLLGLCGSNWICNNFGNRKKGHYERGLFTGEISRISNIDSKISKFSRMSRRWLDCPLFSTVWRFFGLSKFSRISDSRKWTFCKDPFCKRPLFPNPIIAKRCLQTLVWRFLTRNPSNSLHKVTAMKNPIENLLDTMLPNLDSHTKADGSGWELFHTQSRARNTLRTNKKLWARWGDCPGFCMCECWWKHV